MLPLPSAPPPPECLQASANSGLPVPGSPPFRGPSAVKRGLPPTCPSPALGLSPTNCLKDQQGYLHWALAPAHLGHWAARDSQVVSRPLDSSHHVALYIPSHKPDSHSSNTVYGPVTQQQNLYIFNLQTSPSPCFKHSWALPRRYYFPCSPPSGDYFQHPSSSFV